MSTQAPPPAAPELILVATSMSVGHSADGTGAPCTVLTMATASGVGRMSLPLTDAGVSELIDRLRTARHDTPASGLIAADRHHFDQLTRDLPR